ncbi:hypothetical protein D0T85_07000 [Bacteroides sp. 519]|nr:DUF5723 family protein [Bacteroides sp. 519]NDV57849.1 hypothetical protein [Bacteroides sp. 519]
MKKTITTFLVLFVSFYASAQYSRTSYFMEGASQRIQLNPALRPTKGFVDILAIGALNVSASTNAISVSDITTFIDSEDEFYNRSKMYNRLKEDNRLNVNLNTDIISFGFYKGKGFWSANIGLRTDIGASIPKGMFEYARDFYNEGVGKTGVYDIRNQSVNLNAYTEVGVGYSRIITDKLTVGAKVKFLLGIANAEIKLDQLYIDEGGTYTEIRSKGHIDVSMSGMDLETSIDEDDGKEYIDDIDFDKFGFAGYGAGLDLGATYRVLDNLTVSASLLDLGFISWSAGSTTSGKAAKDFRVDYDGTGYLGSDGIFDLELPGYEIVGSKSRTTSLAATFVVGGEYAFLNNKLSAGLLSVTRFGNPKTLSEITLSANYRPKSWFNATFSYSLLQSGLKTFGLGVKVGPLFLATDYMYLGDSTKNANVYLGVSVPLGGSKNKKTKETYE